MASTSQEGESETSQMLIELISNLNSEQTVDATSNVSQDTNSNTLVSTVTSKNNNKQRKDRKRLIKISRQKRPREITKLMIILCWLLRHLTFTVTRYEAGETVLPFPHIWR